MEQPKSSLLIAKSTILRGENAALGLPAELVSGREMADSILSSKTP
jgi:hypothetical protein